MPSKSNEAVPEHVAPTNIQWVPCTTYPVPPPSPDYYKGEHSKEDDDDDSDLPICNVGVKWYDSDDDSYYSRCPTDKKYSCKRPPTIRLERKFLQFFDGRQKGVPYWAVLEIQVDLQEEYYILVCARSTATMRRQAKKGQHCFVEHNIKRCQELEYLIWLLETKACAKKEKGLVPLKVSALSQEDQDYYHEQKNHFQTIANAYTAWYDCQCEITQNSNCNYFYCNLWEVDFELPSGAPETQLNGFLNDT